MAGLLDFINTPQGVGLLSAVAGGLAGARRGTPINNIGRGLVTGVAGYQGAQDQIRQDKENALTQQYKQMQMQELERQMTDKKAQQEWKAGLPGMMAPKLTGSTDQGKQLADQNAAFGAEGIPDLVDSAQYAQPEAPLNVNYGADKQAVQDYMMQPNSPYADDLIKQKFVPKPEEYGTTPFVDSEGNAQLIGKTGATKTLPFKGAPKEGASPYGQDMREYLAVNGIDPANATPQQLQAAYTATNQQKDRRAPKTTVSVGGATVINEAAREKLGGKLGADIGQQAAAIEGKWSALDSVREAKEQLKKGIYAGAWGGVATEAAKRTSGAIGNLDKVTNTETYLSYIGNTVIPRLSEFGGNDSVEEMKYLQSVMGGNIRLEPKALERILNSVEIKIQRGIERLQRQQETIEKGGVPALDGGPGRAQPKPPKAAPQRGEVRNGYKYFGGDPASPKSWVKVKQ